MASVYKPDWRRWLALDRERAVRSDPANGLPEVAWLEREWISESRSVAACILRAEACCWDVAPEDVRWAAEWVANDEGWQESWGKLPAEVSP